MASVDLITHMGFQKLVLEMKEKKLLDTNMAQARVEQAPTLFSQRDQQWNEGAPRASGPSFASDAPFVSEQLFDRKNRNKKNDGRGRMTQARVERAPCCIAL
jgi:hypothetical protein